ncbi:hypothetical protein [Streptomyces melanogenes]|uniref:hypothetical protein n=1 Tax=Streptomyces melanogenes TaxID=67326 RepID=UPI00378A4766
MAEMVKQQELSVFVDYFGLCLRDADDARLPALFPDGYEPGPFLTAREGRLDVTSAGHTHWAHLTVQVWDGMPPKPIGDWEEDSSASLFCAAGKLQVRGVTGPMPEQVTLSNGPAKWSVRLLCTGRAEVAEAANRGVVHDVERYTAQFWPAP